MKTFYTLLITVVLSLFYKPSFAQKEITPFATPSPLPLSPIHLQQPAKLISLNGYISNKKVILQWEVSENETADQFEVEKSTNGKTFVMAGLVFGTDKPETDTYQFYEKTNNKKVSYRIKLINKDKKIAYSAVVRINPRPTTEK